MADAAAQALTLLNALRKQLGQPPLEAIDPEQARQLGEAHPLLVMLGAAAGGKPSPGLEERCQAWNKALRRRGWDRLPALERAEPEPAEAVARLEELFALFGLTLAAGAVPGRAVLGAATEIATLIARARALCTPPLVEPDRYAQEHAAIRGDYEATRSRHAELPPLA